MPTEELLRPPVFGSWFCFALGPQDSLSMLSSLPRVGCPFVLGLCRLRRRNWLWLMPVDLIGVVSFLLCQIPSSVIPQPDFPIHIDALPHFLDESLDNMDDTSSAVYSRTTPPATSA
ncbi:hypothetical protein D9619_008379 [Psilocybe cf. subviscida]|uniref:Uncharacterized protein n=1 Tax=Psilocybe cf. subviscida TaxID=2480587 RepID=A0A8H5BAF3_9AGAR|nr:hypothetical protein D9619_008379 [Psilocybe cf. subviscida]